MRPRKLASENRVLRAVAGQDLSVSLGRAVQEIIDTPTLTDLVGNAPTGVIGGMTDEQRSLRIQNDKMRRSRKSLLESQLRTATDPIIIENLTGQLDTIDVEGGDERDAFVQESIDAGRLIDTDQLKEEYGDRLKFDGPMVRQEAQALYDQKKAEAVRQAILERSPKGFAATTVKLGAGLLNQMTDPIEVASAFIPFVGPAGRAYSIARFGRVGGRATQGAVEGMLGAAVIEPIYYGLSTSQQLDYTMREALLNVGAGLVLGGGFGTIAGVMSRHSIDANAVAKSIEPDASLKTTVDPEVIPSIPKMTDVESAVVAKQTRENISKSYDLLGGKVTADMAIRQMVNDIGVNVSVKAPRIPRKPQTITEFIRAKGGMNDEDVTFRGELASRDVKGRASYVTSRGNLVNSLSNPGSNLNADNIAEAAQEAGFITKRDTNELFDAIDQDLRAKNGDGEFVFSIEDQEMAEDWRNLNGAKSNYDAEIERRLDIRNVLDENKATDVSDEEIAMISEYMSRNNSTIDEATYEMGVDLSRTKLQMEYDYAVDLKSDPYADFEASMRIEEAEIREEADIDFGPDEAVIQQLRDENLLTPENIKELDEIAALDAEFAAFSDVVDAVSTCIVRS
tara:strand:- start:1302 stop:3170 length:1869 start_codon:yes stop_codon:yes gene_type:complete